MKIFWRNGHKGNKDGNFWIFVVTFVAFTAVVRAPAEDRVLLLVAEAVVAASELVEPAAEVFLIRHERPSASLGGSVLVQQDAGSSL